MVSREQLRTQGLWAYETGRLRASARVALVLVPVAVLCLLESRGRGTCACLAVMLLSLATWLRWRNRRGLDAVTTGLLAGSAPLTAGLLLDGFDLQCSLAAGGAAFCTGVAVLLGGAAGVFIGVRERRRRGRIGSAVAAAAVAALAASLGCVRLGVVGFASVVAGIVVGLAGTAVVTSRGHVRAGGA